MAPTSQLINVPREGAFEKALNLSSDGLIVTKRYAMKPDAERFEVDTTQ